MLRTTSGEMSEVIYIQIFTTVVEAERQGEPRPKQQTKQPTFPCGYLTLLKQKKEPNNIC